MDFQRTFRSFGFGNLPPAVKNILIINVIMFLAMLAFRAKFGMDLNELLGLHYPTSEKFRWYQVITHMFMHANLGHIFVNMYALWMFGTALENLWGVKRFLIYYFICGIGAALLQTLYTSYQLHNFDQALSLVEPESYYKLISHYFDSPNYANFYNSWKLEPHNPDAIAAATQNLVHVRLDLVNSSMLGASGAVMGILLGFGMLFPNTELMLIFFPIPIKAKYFVLGYGLIELFSGVSEIAGDNIAHFAHVGGMIFGFILIKIWGKNRNYFY